MGSRLGVYMYTCIYRFNPFHTFCISFQVTSDAPLLAVRYFLPTKGARKKGKQLFMPDDDVYQINDSDILKVLPEPDFKLVGSRLYYMFTEL